MPKSKSKPKAYIVAVDMGYGHQRAAFPLKSLAYKNEIITANTYGGIPVKDRKVWKDSKKFYDFISVFKKVPLVGDYMFKLYDQLQEIPKFYPRRDLSKPNIQLKQIYRFMEDGWGKHLIDKLAKKPLPIITTFFVTAFMAEIHDYPGEIYCIVTDTDISRTWVAKNPSRSKIKYFASSYRAVERLKLYGVSDNHIFLTGFPLPLENLGDETLSTLRQDVVNRLANLDPEKKYYEKYHQLVSRYLKVKKIPAKSNHPLTVMFAVGGAGAQKDIGEVIIKSLKNRIINKEIRVILVAGIHNSVASYFKKVLRENGLRKELDKGVKIVFSNSKDDYFKKFNQILRETDILWTKPSELSFYTALGLPIIIAPPIGSQEEFNRKWLRTIGSAASQFSPEHADEWLFDWLESGWFAEAAMQGFVEAPKFGTFNIEKIISGDFEKENEPKMLLQY